MSRKGKTIPRGDQRLPGAGGRGSGQWMLMGGYKASFWGDGKVWNWTGVMVVQLRKCMGKIMKLDT